LRVRRGALAVATLPAGPDPRLGRAGPARAQSRAGRRHLRKVGKTGPQVGESPTCGPSGGQGRGRTADLPLFRRTLVPTELPAQQPESIQPADGGAESGDRRPVRRTDRQRETAKARTVTVRAFALAT